jgi:hypothetical protein
MSRSLGINKQRTPVFQEPPRGPITSIASAKNMSQAQNMSTAQQQQQQMLKQQYMQQQQQLQQQKLKQQMANQQPQQPQSGMPPSHVTVPQAIAVIVSRLNSIERKISKSDAQSLGEPSEEQQQESINLDLTIDQILERLQALESAVVSKSDFEQLNNKVSKLDSDLRDSKDMFLKMQSLLITTTEQVTKLSMQLNTISSVTDQADN